MMAILVMASKPTCAPAARARATTSHAQIVFVT
jgi:hypothetical protein